MRYWIKKNFFKKTDSVVEVKDIPNDITDEIEKSLLELKEAFDLPTEEVEFSLESRRIALNKRISKF